MGWHERGTPALPLFGALGALSLSAFVGYVKIYGESEESLTQLEANEIARLSMG